MLDFSILENMPDADMLKYVNMLRENKAVYLPMLRPLAKGGGMEEWLALLTEDRVPPEGIVRLFHIVRDHRAEGVDAVRAAIASDPLLGGLMP